MGLSLVNFIYEESNVELHKDEDIAKAFLLASINNAAELEEKLDHIPINTQDENGMTLLHHAAISLSQDTVSLLLSREGIDPTIQDNFDRSASWATIEVNGEIEEAVEISNKLDSYCYPAIFND